MLIDFFNDEDSDPQITIIGRSKNIYALYDAKYKHLAAKDYLFNKIENLEKSNFDQIILQKKHIKLVHFIKDKEKLVNSSCSCAYFLKNYICEHIVALALNVKLVDMPLRYTKIQFSKKTKSGAKPKSSKALKRMRMV